MMLPVCCASCGSRLDELLAEIVADDDSGEPEAQRDAVILRSMPGVGRIVLATLFAEASQLLAERDYLRLRILTGVAPVTKRSGKSCQVSMRRACNQRLSNAMYHWARVAIQHDPVSRERYAALRARGQRHGRALRTVADRLLAVACAMLRDRTERQRRYRERRKAAQPRVQYLTPLTRRAVRLGRRAACCRPIGGECRP